MKLRRLSLALLLCYAFLSFYSIIGKRLNIAPVGIMTPLVTLSGFIFALVHSGQREGWKRALWLLALVFSISLIFESVGVATGWIYGPYHYTNSLGPKFLGLVPYLIPAAWFMMSYPSYVIAERLVPSAWKRWQRILTVSAVGGLVMTSWDLVMDPIMVEGGNWVWDKGGSYFGIPLQNFWGWWLTVFTTLTVYLWLYGRVAKPAEPGLDRQALISYLITGMNIVIVSLLSGEGGLALIGFFTIIPWVLSAWLKITSVSVLKVNTDFKETER